jgi:hypothetical protein
LSGVLRSLLSDALRGACAPRTALAWPSVTASVAPGAVRPLHPRSTLRIARFVARRWLRATPLPTVRITVIAHHGGAARRDSSE